MRPHRELLPGEIFDAQIDCLQLQVRKPEQVEAETYEVSMGDFSLMNVFDEIQKE